MSERKPKTVPKLINIDNSLYNSFRDKVKEEGKGISKVLEDLIRGYLGLPIDSVKKLYTTRELSEILGVVPITIRNWNKSGKINGKIIGGKLFFDLDEIEKKGL